MNGQVSTSWLSHKNGPCRNLALLALNAVERYFRSPPHIVAQRISGRVVITRQAVKVSEKS